MKHVVICYSIHNREIASYDTFDTMDDAKAFLEKDAQNTYDEELNSALESEKDQIELTIDDDTAYLSSHNDEYLWTWEIISIS
jgi:hypothetical protein